MKYAVQPQSYVTVFAADVPDQYRPIKTFGSRMTAHYRRESIAHHLFVGDLVACEWSNNGVLVNVIVVGEDGGDRIKVMAAGLMGVITLSCIAYLNGLPVRG